MPLSRSSEEEILAFGPWLLAASVVFLVFEFTGAIYPNWMANPLCFRIIGCNAGFFGYDSLVHGVSGIAETLTIFWAAERFPRFNVFHSSSLSLSALMVLGIVSLASVSWELIEFFWDTVLVVVPYINLIVLNQPSAADTIGDTSLGLFGSIVTLALLARFAPSLMLNPPRSEN